MGQPALEPGSDGVMRWGELHFNQRHPTFMGMSIKNLICAYSGFLLVSNEKSIYSLHPLKIPFNFQIGLLLSV